MSKLSIDDIEFMCIVAVISDMLLTFLLFVVREEYGFDFDCSEFWLTFGLLSLCVIKFVTIWYGVEE